MYTARLRVTGIRHAKERRKFAFQGSSTDRVMTSIEAVPDDF